MSLIALARAVADLLHGLFAFPGHSAPERGPATVAAAIEARYSRPRRCC